jgi:hypothetical protein
MSGQLMTIMMGCIVMLSMMIRVLGCGLLMFAIMMPFLCFTLFLVLVSHKPLIDNNIKLSNNLSSCPF